MSSGKDTPRSFDGEIRAVTPEGTAVVELMPEPLFNAEPKSNARFALWGAGFAVALGLSAAGMFAIHSGASDTKLAEARAQVDASAQLMKNLQAEVGRLKGSVDQLRVASESTRQDDTLRGLRRSVDGLKQEIEQVKTASGTNLAQLSNKIDKVDHDPNPKLAEIASRLDKLDAATKAADKEASAQRIADVQNRLERIEKQVSSSMATGSIAPAAKAATPVPVPVPAPTPVLPPAKSSATVPPTVKPTAKQEGSSVQVAEAKPASAPHTPTLAHWALRDVYDGVAVVEERGGDVQEVMPGQYIPGLGAIRSIERRGRSWVVMTDRGIIE